MFGCFLVSLGNKEGAEVGRLYIETNIGVCVCVERGGGGEHAQTHTVRDKTPPACERHAETPSEKTSVTTSVTYLTRENAP